MSATQTSTRIDSRKLMPTTRACATASQASPERQHAADQAQAPRDRAASRRTPPRSSAAPASTQAPPGDDPQRRQRPVEPARAHQDTAHSATQRAPTDSDGRRPAAVQAAPLPGGGADQHQRDGERRAAAMRQNSAGSRMASRTMAVMMRCLSMRGVGLRRPSAARPAARPAAEVWPKRRSRAGVVGDGLVERGLVELGPQLVAEVQLGVGAPARAGSC